MNYTYIKNHFTLSVIFRENSNIIGDESHVEKRKKETKEKKEIECKVENEVWEKNQKMNNKTYFQLF